MDTFTHCLLLYIINVNFFRFNVNFFEQDNKTRHTNLIEQITLDFFGSNNEKMRNLLLTTFIEHLAKDDTCIKKGYVNQTIFNHVISAVWYDHIDAIEDEDENQDGM